MFTISKATMKKRTCFTSNMVEIATASKFFSISKKQIEKCAPHDPVLSITYETGEVFAVW